MLRRSFKRVKEVVDKMRLPVVVRLSRSLLDDARNDTDKAKRQFVLRQLTRMGQCRELVHLNLRDNGIRAAGSKSFARVLGQCALLAHLNLGCNGIGQAGGGRLRASWRGHASGLLL